LANDRARLMGEPNLIQFERLVRRDRTVLELSPILVIAVRRAPEACFREPAIGHIVIQRDAEFIDCPGSAIDRGLIEDASAASARECETRTAARGD
jgi:hypothetical protein